MICVQAINVHVESKNSAHLKEGVPLQLSSSSSSDYSRTSKKVKMDSVCDRESIILRISGLREDVWEAFVCPRTQHVAFRHHSTGRIQYEVPIHDISPTVTVVEAEPCRTPCATPETAWMEEPPAAETVDPPPRVFPLTKAVPTQRFFTLEAHWENSNERTTNSLSPVVWNKMKTMGEAEEEETTEMDDISSGAPVRGHLPTLVIPKHEQFLHTRASLAVPWTPAPRSAGRESWDDEDVPPPPPRGHSVPLEGEHGLGALHEEEDGDDC